MLRDPFDSLFHNPAEFSPDPDKSIRDIEGRRKRRKRCPECGELDVVEGEDMHGRYRRCRSCKRAWALD